MKVLHSGKLLFGGEWGFHSHWVGTIVPDNNEQ